jgi:nucleotide-binding universal stress UspA family protein
MQTGLEGRQSRPQRRPVRPRVVLAAVDNSDLAVPVIEAAAEHARLRGWRLVVVTVIPVPATRDLGEGGRLGGEFAAQDDALQIIDRVQPTLDASEVANQVLVRGYLARGGPRRQARRVACTVLRVADEVEVATIVVGRRRGSRRPVHASQPA